MMESGHLLLQTIISQSQQRCLFDATLTFYLIWDNPTIRKSTLFSKRTLQFIFSGIIERKGFVLILIQMQGEQVTYQVVLPTLAKRGNLFDEAAVPKAQFLVGYRNILTLKGETVQCGLVKSKQHCGRAFVYPIDESKAAGINQFKGEDEYIETVGTSFILLKVEKDVVKPTAQLGVDAVRGLLEQLGGVDKINLNLIKNAFDSLQEYRSVVDSQTESALGVELGIKELELTEKIQIQCKSKTLSGAALKQLPLISKETGKWDNEKTINLKVLEH